MKKHDKELRKVMRKAIKEDNLSQVEELLDRNPELLSETSPLGSWLHVAATHGKRDIAEYLVKQGLDVNQNGTVADCGAVTTAAEKGHLDIVKLLHENGAVFDTSRAAKNPLFAAIYGGHLEVAKYLVEAGIDLTAKYNLGQLDGVDACEYARQYGQKEIENYLIEKMK